jgi:hypothetical protein
MIGVSHDGLASVLYDGGLFASGDVGGIEVVDLRDVMALVAVAVRIHPEGVRL